MSSRPSALRGVFVPPGDKSISHRALIFGALAGGDCEIRGRLRAGDVDHTVGVLRQLGVSIEERADTVLVHGCGGRFNRPESALDAGSSATTVRLMAGALASWGQSVTFTGSSSLIKRPMGRIFGPLARMGVDWRAEDGGECLPIRMKGGPLQGRAFSLQVASAQVQSGLLLAGLSAEGQTSVTLPRPVRDHTVRMMQHLGLQITTEDGLTVRLNGPQRVPGFELTVPGDASSAAFVGTAAAMLPGSDVEIREVNLNPGRIGWLRVLERMGADITVASRGRWAGEPVGDVRIRAQGLRGTQITADEIPGLIDELPVLAMAAAVAEGVTSVEGAEELRVKESDRIETVATGLRALGVEVDTAPGGFCVQGSPDGVRSGAVDAAGDHRIALSFSVLSLRADGVVALRGKDTVRDSFPAFFRVLETLQNG